MFANGEGDGPRRVLEYNRGALGVHMERDAALMQLVALGCLGFHGVIVLVGGELAAGFAAGIHGDGGNFALIRGVVYVEGGLAQCVCRVAVSQVRRLGALGELDVHIEHELPFSGAAALVRIGAWHGARCTGRCVLAFDQHEVRAIWVSLCLKRI